MIVRKRFGTVLDDWWVRGMILRSSIPLELKQGFPTAVKEGILPQMQRQASQEGLVQKTN